LVVNHFLLYYQYRSQSELKINKLRKTEPESDSEEFIYHVKEPEDYVPDEEI